MPPDAGEQPARREYRGLRLLDFRDDAAIKRSWVVDGIFARDELSLLIAPPFAGKSALAVHLARSIASGQPWFGRNTAAGAVLIIAAERTREIARRVNASVGDDDLPIAIADGTKIDLRSASSIHQLTETIDEVEDRHGPVAAVIVDTFAAVTPGADETSARDVTAALNNLARVRAHSDAHWLLAHHTPRNDSKQVRGHSAIDGAADVIVSVNEANGHHNWRVLAANTIAEPFPTGSFKLASAKLAAGHAVAMVVEAAGAHQGGGQLPPDAKLALHVLTELCGQDGRERQEDWRAAVLTRFGDRKSGALRQAWSAAKNILISQGLVTTNGEFVSVRTPSE